MKIQLTESQLNTVILKTIKVLKESNEEYQNIALDKMNQVGGYDKLGDLNKLALLGGSGDYEKLKQLDLGRIFKENGGTFGKNNIKIKILPINEQPNKHKFSQELAGREGYLVGPIHYSDKSEPYVTVKFKEFEPNKDMKGGGTYPQYPIMMDNMFPIDYDYIDPEFLAYDRKVDQERKDMMTRWGIDPDNPPF